MRDALAFIILKYYFNFKKSFAQFHLRHALAAMPYQCHDADAFQNI